MGCNFSTRTLQAPNFEFAGNKFNAEESALLFRNFQNAAHFTGNKLKLKPHRIAKDSTFIMHFPFLKSHETLARTIFYSFFPKEDRDYPGINYKWYLRFMSILARGNGEERCRLAMRLIDLNKDKNIERTELIQFITKMNKLLKEADPGHQAVDPVQTANHIFEPLSTLTETDLRTCFHRFAKHKDDVDPAHSKKDLIDKDEFYGRKNVSSMAYHEFLDAAVHVKEFSRGFGLFPLLFKRFVKPVIKIASQEDIMTGYLKTGRWNTRFCVVGGGFMVFYDKLDTEQKQPTHMITLQEAKVQPKIDSAGKEFIITTPKFSRVFEAVSEEECLKWIGVIWLNCGPTIPHRYDSFAPVCHSAAAKAYVCGKDYFADLVKDIRAAKHQILITAWALSPNIYLTRDGEGNLTDRLDSVLLEVAKRGVKVYILLWDEVQAAFKYLNSLSVTRYMNKLHKNIVQVRDPSSLSDLFHLWSHHQKTVIIDQDLAYAGGIDLAFNRWDDIENYSVIDEEGKTFPGQHYVNPMAHTPNHSVGDSLKTEYMKRDQWPRMPWHDLQVKIIGQPARYLARNFIQRWEVSRSKVDSNNYVLPKLTPLPQPDKMDRSFTKHKDCTVQVLRSAGDWSFMFSEHESSMYNAQMHAIRHAKHFIYIENQFFLSAVRSDQVNPSNLLMKAVVDRIAFAIEKKQKFKLIFLTPIHASSDLNSLFTRTLTFWQQSCQHRGKLSLIGHLKERFPNVNIADYVTISSLRNWGRFSSGKMVSEMVYVHSKMMIVDDKIAFISSCNVNDRSMLGGRDSEIGCSIEDNEKITSTMGGIETKVGRFAHDLRMKLWKYHLGLKDDQMDLIKDPIQAYDLWNKTATANTKTYVEVFKKLPDNIESLSVIKYMTRYNLKDRYYVPSTDEEEEKLKTIQGRLIEYPIRFLYDSYNFPAIEPGIDSLYV